MLDNPFCSTYTYYQDASNSPVALTAGYYSTVVERYIYDAFGQEDVLDGAWDPVSTILSGNPWLFTSQEFLADIGLSNYKNRFYNTDLGRFLQQDPIRFEAGDLNLFRYVGNNPANSTDPLGLLEYSYSGGVLILRPWWKSMLGIEPSLKDVYLISPEGARKILLEHKITDAAIDHAAQVFVAAMEERRGESRENSEEGEEKKKTYQTYTKTNPETGQVYSGRTSGEGTPEENVANRDKDHHKNKEGFGPAQLDQTSSNPDAIRGREQQLIEANGRAQSQGGTSGNAINGVSPTNPKKEKYKGAAQEEFSDD